MEIEQEHQTQRRRPQKVERNQQGRAVEQITDRPILPGRFAQPQQSRRPVEKDRNQRTDRKLKNPHPEKRPAGDSLQERQKQGVGVGITVGEIGEFPYRQPRRALEHGELVGSRHGHWEQAVGAPHPQYAQSAKEISQVNDQPETAVQQFLHGISPLPSL